jgi:hypothetical protein
MVAYTLRSDYSTKVFGFASFGRIYGTIVCLAGLSNFTQPGLDALRHDAFHDNPTPINIALGTSGALVGLILSLYTEIRGRRFLREKTEAEEANEAQHLLGRDQSNYGSTQDNS